MMVKKKSRRNIMNIFANYKTPKQKKKEKRKKKKK